MPRIRSQVALNMDIPVTCFRTNYGIREQKFTAGFKEVQRPRVICDRQVVPTIAERQASDLVPNCDRNSFALACCWARLPTLAWLRKRTRLTSQLLVLCSSVLAMIDDPDDF